MTDPIWDQHTQSWYKDPEPDIDYAAAPLWAYRGYEGTRRQSGGCPVLALLLAFPARLLREEYQECRRLFGGGYCAACMTEVTRIKGLDAASLAPPPSISRKPAAHASAEEPHESVQDHQHNDHDRLFGT